MSVTSKYILTHSGFVEVSDDELIHFKYIKRERKNGRWVYYYDESQLKRAEADYNKARSEKQNAASNYKDAKELADLHAGPVFTKRSAKKQIAAQRKEREAAYKYRATARKARKLEKKYNQQKMTAFAAKSISKGLNKITKFFSGSSKKKKK